MLVVGKIDLAAYQARPTFCRVAQQYAGPVRQRPPSPSAVRALQAGAYC